MIVVTPQAALGSQIQGQHDVKTKYNNSSLFKHRSMKHLNLLENFSASRMPSPPLVIAKVDSKQGDGSSAMEIMAFIGCAIQKGEPTNDARLVTDSDN
uniref:Uncharacterized protein n=1 Tax=Romanomermis culicivorax TaxID=13658 RepID=A0A915HNG3_ROMCU